MSAKDQVANDGENEDTPTSVQSLAGYPESCSRVETDPVEHQFGVDPIPAPSCVYESQGSQYFSSADGIDVSDAVALPSKYKTNPRGVPHISQLQEGRESQVFDFVAEGLDAAEALLDDEDECSDKSSSQFALDEECNEDDEQNQLQERRHDSHSRPAPLIRSQAQPRELGFVGEAEAQPEGGPDILDEVFNKARSSVRAFSGGYISIQRKRNQPDQATPMVLHGKHAKGKKKARLINRNSVFSQANTKVNVHCMPDAADRQICIDLYKLWSLDWFDTLLSLRTSYTILFLSTLYTVQLLIFAGFYQSASDHCDTTQPMDFMQAFGFSLETSITVGYTLPEANEVMFFNGCGSWIVLIYIQCVFSLIFNGLVIGTLLLRIARAERRANQIIFSNKACILCIRGRFYFTFQVYDLQARHPVIGASVRIFAVFQVAENLPDIWQARALRLSRPNDELGSRLWLSVPCLVVHEIDAWSALAPSEITRPPQVVTAVAANRFPMPPQRVSDSRAGSHNHTTCVICGAPFQNEATLRRHILYTAENERIRGRPESFGHRAINPRSITRPIVARDNTEENTGQQTSEATASKPSVPSPGSVMSEDHKGENRKHSYDKHNDEPELVVATTRRKRRENRERNSSVHRHHPTSPSAQQAEREDHMEQQDDCQQTDDILKHVRRWSITNLLPTWIGGNNTTKYGVLHEAAKEKEARLQQLDFIHPRTTRDAIRERFRKRSIEVICLVEGTDPHTANSFQARHSYSFDDLEFDAQHAPCLGVGTDVPGVVNLSQFHKVFRYNQVNVEEPLPFTSYT